MGVILLVIISITSFVLISVNNSKYDSSLRIIKIVKDPKGNRIRIVEDDDYLVKVDTEYHYKEAERLSKKSKHMSYEQIDKLTATDIQKEVMKKVVERITDYIAPDEFEIRDGLKRLYNYDEETIEYAMNNTGIDWKEQAKIQALIILAGEGYSKQSLIDLMESKGFSSDVVKEAVSNKSLDFYEQAIYSACFIKYTEKINGIEYSQKAS